MEALSAFVAKFPGGSVSDFANYYRALQSIQQL